MLTIKEQAHISFRELRRSRKELYRAIKEAERNPSVSARALVHKLLDEMLKKKRQFEELTIMRDAVWQNDYRQ